MANRATTGVNITSSLKVLAEKLLMPQMSARDDATFQVQERLASFLRLEARSLTALNSPDADFVVLHLPVPHPPGIYDRHTGRFADKAGQSYVDNLALSDIVLGKLLSILRSSPRWPETTILVNGDHGWRTPGWRSDATWTDEDERASRGIFDVRPALLIHHAGQVISESIKQPTPLLDLHGILVTMLRSPGSSQGPSLLSQNR